MAILEALGGQLQAGSMHSGGVPVTDLVHEVEDASAGTVLSENDDLSPLWFSERGRPIEGNDSLLSAQHFL